jgi:hypothetical protein
MTTSIGGVPYRPSCGNTGRRRHRNEIHLEAQMPSPVQGRMWRTVRDLTPGHRVRQTCIPCRLFVPCSLALRITWLADLPHIAGNRPAEASGQPKTAGPSNRGAKTGNSYAVKYFGVAHGQLGVLTRRRVSASRASCCYHGIMRFYYPRGCS